MKTIKENLEQASSKEHSTNLTQPTNKDLLKNNAIKNYNINKKEKSLFYL